MQLGIFAKTFPGDTPQAVMTAAAQAGYAQVQYNMACSGLAALPDSLSAEQARAVHAAASSAGLGVAAVSGTFNMLHPDRSVVEAGLGRLDVLASRCKEMGTRLITLCTGSRDPHDQWKHHPDNTRPESWRALRVAMEAALSIAAKHDVLLGIEPELANVVNSAAKAKTLVRELDDPRLTIILDAANLFEVADLKEQQRIVAEAADVLAEHIAMAHAKDRAADGSFVAAGQGVLDFGHYLRCLRRAGFDGPLVTHGLAAGEAPAVARFLGHHLSSTADTQA